jgi:WD40 repeat protein
MLTSPDLSCINRSAVTALRFNADGVQLASGAQDTDIVVWDIVSQAGLFRLRGHHGQVNLRAQKATQCHVPVPMPG